MLQVFQKIKWLNGYIVDLMAFPPSAGKKKRGGINQMPPQKTPVKQPFYCARI